MKTKEKTTKDILVENGFKYEDVARAFGQLYSYYARIQKLEQMIVLDSKSGLRGRGNESADILVVSDYLDESEINTGFIGFSDYAMYLTIFFNRLGIHFEDVYWTSVIKYPNQRVTMSLIKQEFEKLKDEIQMVAPNVIIALGTTAISALAQEPIKIEKAIGGDFSYNINEHLEDILVIPLIHPRHIIQKDKEEFRKITNQTWQSLKILRDLL